MKVNQRLENIFSHAVALQQSGRLRNTVYCLKNRVYILNQDQTVLLRFLLRKGEVEFHSPVSFSANDYDSQEMEEKDGRITFIQKAAGFVRAKACRTPDFSPEEVEQMFREKETADKNRVQLHSKVLSLLDGDLSHIEFSSKKGKLSIIQRNVYSGSVTELRREEAGGLGIGVKDELEDFGPVGIRTPDFLALFAFTDSLSLYFPESDWAWVQSDDPKMPMKGLLSRCAYDELGGEDNGRKEPKERRS